MASRRKILDNIKQLRNISKSSHVQTYGVSKNMADLLDEKETYSQQFDKNSDKNKALINSHIAPSKVNKPGKLSDNKMDDLYDLISDKKIIDNLEVMLGAENISFKRTIKDYEIIKRCIPQVHKVILSLKNNIMNPDSINKSAIGIKMPSGTTEEDREKIMNIIDDYSLNTKLSDIVLNYLIVSVKYLTVVPYSSIVDMISHDAEKTSLEEAITSLDKKLSEGTKPLLEASCDNNLSLGVLQESIDEYGISFEENDVVVLNGFKNALNEIEFVNGGMSYYKNAILNEAINIIDSGTREERSMRRILKKISKNSNKKKKDENVIDGLVTDEVADEIRKNVNFKGAHIEELDPTRVVPFKMRGTVIGYFYVEDKVDMKSNLTQSSVMDKINSAVYTKNFDNDKRQRMESMVISTITDNLIKCVNSKFINDNYDDIDIIYEFVRENEIHKKGKRVIFFHPDDICEFKREDGSVMKNAMFMAKLYILTILSNVITNVTRGADRQLYYVKTGLSTDIEGHVNNAIRRIKQSQLRYSDFGTIHDIFNVVGGNVDVFMPQSVDGERPVETEVISGQNVDMNDQFIEFLMRSIILSFGVPSVVVDQMDQVELARTLSMSNLDIAKTTLDAQLEILPPLTKLIRNVVRYQIPDYEDVDELEATLNAPIAILLEMSRDLMDSIQNVSETLSNLLIPQENESKSDRKMRLFKLEYFKRNNTNIDWDAVADILKTIELDAKEQELEDSIDSEDDSGGDSGSGF